MNLQLQPYIVERPTKLALKCPRNLYQKQRQSFMGNYKSMNRNSLVRKESQNNPREHFKTVHKLEPMNDVKVETSSGLDDYGHDIEVYEKSIESRYLPKDCLRCHEITGELRGKMVDWMVEVMNSFKCKNQTFFMAVSLMDRYLDKKLQRKATNELHVIGVAAIYLASKYEDILPLRMSTVVSKIAHRKLSPGAIKAYEQDILLTLDYYVQTPTVLEFLTRYIELMAATLRKHKDWVLKMSIYLAKLCAHDYAFCSVKPSRVAVSSIYVALKICEQLNRGAIGRMAEVSGYGESEIVECARRILADAQNFEALFPGLANLKRSHFSELMECIPK